MGLVNLYLVLYNAISCIGWGVVLYLSLLTYFDKTRSMQEYWEEVEMPLKVIQSLAAMEIVHAVFGFVRSPVVSTAMQVSSRLVLLWMVVNISADVRAHWGMLLMVTSWSCVEVPRYTFYACNLIEDVPSWLFFLRYHLFMVLYPSGVLGEVLCVVNLLKTKTIDDYAIALPNAHNVSFSLSTFMIILLIIYVPGLPIMYMHMLQQRRRAYAKLKQA